VPAHNKTHQHMHDEAPLHTAMLSTASTHSPFQVAGNSKVHISTQSSSSTPKLNHASSQAFKHSTASGSVPTWNA
jgi:hypothetical protein